MTPDLDCGLSGSCHKVVFTWGQFLSKGAKTGEKQQESRNNAATQDVDPIILILPILSFVISEARLKIPWP
jgi:hypothetical protein